ncbi:hypothetical protein Fot_47991 [Forsythia ovata]|uniref:Uncharacterized protein n=1 Tax=Forsythia ovata TaxID=205694 RepID=A0ABD1QRZ1_9LAMI
MAMLCFVLDLRSLSSPILRDLKQLANYYSISAPKINDNCNRIRSKSLRDRIGLCYVFKNRLTCSDELKVAYNPSVNFNLRDFHHAVNNIPNDAFSPEFDKSGALCCKDLKLSDVLNNKVIYSWGGNDKDISRKIVLLSSCIVESLDYVTKKALTEAADKCVSVEFVFLEQNSSHLGDSTENINNFIKQIGCLENCSFRTYLPDLYTLLGLVKRWLQELKEDMEELLQVRFLFNVNLINNLNQISCNLSASFNPLIDGFIPCQTCKCHGIPLDQSNESKTKRSCCPVTSDKLGALDLIGNSVKIGEQTILYMPSFQCIQKLQQVSSPVDFNVIQRTNLGLLSEGLITGATYIVTPSTCHDLEDNDKSELNNQLFQVVCSVLNSLDQGLVCSSNCNIETAIETSFKCYYILLPSDKGLMLLRRLAGSEEVLPIPDVSQFISSMPAKEIENTVQASLLKMEVSEYNPVQHERGFHRKLNLLVKESLQFGAIRPKTREATSETDSTLQDSSAEVQQTMQNVDVTVMGEKTSQLDTKLSEDKTSACITQEWEQLIITEVVNMNSPTCISKPKLDHPVPSPLQNNRRVDEKTSRILERLEVPRQLKRKTVSPTISSSVSADMCASLKKPLIPFGPDNTIDQGPTASQPRKPSFQRRKR